MQEMKKLVFAFMVMTLFSALSAAAEPVKILVLHSYYCSLPWTQGFRRGLEEAAFNYPEIQYHTEYMDNSRLIKPLTGNEWFEYLTSKYQSVGIDVIIADSGPAAKLIYDYPENVRQNS